MPLITIHINTQASTAAAMDPLFVEAKSVNSQMINLNEVC